MTYKQDNFPCVTRYEVLQLGIDRQFYSMAGVIKDRQCITGVHQLLLVETVKFSAKRNSPDFTAATKNRPQLPRFPQMAVCLQ